MARSLLVGGGLAALVGVALIVPALFAWLGKGSLAGVGIIVVSLGGALILCGLAAIVCGLRSRSGLSMPRAVRAAVTGNILFLAFFALEISDGLVQRGGIIHPISSGLFLPTLLLLYGLVSARRWAWWTARGVAAIFTFWFLGFVAVIPFADLRGSEGPVPWWGRMYMVGVSLVLAGILACVFRALGRPEARGYFGLECRFRAA